MMMMVMMVTMMIYVDNYCSNDDDYDDDDYDYGNGHHNLDNIYHIQVSLSIMAIIIIIFLLHTIATYYSLLTIAIIKFIRFRYRWKPGKFPSTTISLINQPNNHHHLSSTNNGSSSRKSLQRKSIFSRFTVMNTIEEIDNYAIADSLPLHLIRRWPEYDKIDQKDVVVTIEHCCKCWQHRDITFHDEKKYLKVID